MRSLLGRFEFILVVYVYTAVHYTVHYTVPTSTHVTYAYKVSRIFYEHATSVSLDGRNITSKYRYLYVYTCTRMYEYASILAEHTQHSSPVPVLASISYFSFEIMIYLRIYVRTSTHTHIYCMCVYTHIRRVGYLLPLVITF